MKFHNFIAIAAASAAFCFFLPASSNAQTTPPAATETPPTAGQKPQIKLEDLTPEQRRQFQLYLLEQKRILEAKKEAGIEIKPIPKVEDAQPADKWRTWRTEKPMTAEDAKNKALGRLQPPPGKVGTTVTKTIPQNQGTKP